MRLATRIPRIRRGSATCASTTRGSSSAPAPPKGGKSADERLAAHAQDPMALDEDVEVHRIEAVRRPIGEPADIPRRDRVRHPINEGAPIGGRADMPQPPQAGAWESA